MKKGLAQFGASGEKAVEIEIKQLHVLKVMYPVYKHNLSWEEQKRVLEYLMFLKRKQTGQIKARGCADGRKQQEYTSKESAASPTVSNEAVFLTAAIEAREKRDTATVDIPGAFMQANREKEIIHLQLTGLMVDILLQLKYKAYARFVVIERGQRVLYVRLTKALYGTIRMAQLFYNKFSGLLSNMGFVFNPYDP
jgi:hypothetical protein